LQFALALIVFAGGLYAAVYAVAGSNWFKMSENDLSRVEGCYAVAGKQTFRIAGRTLFTSNGTFGFEGAHEKQGDALLMDGPVQIARHPQLMLVRGGTASVVLINYGKPVRLALWDEAGNPVEASQTLCR
jgi:hypothetical protein